MIRYYQSVGALKADENALIAEMNRGMIFRTRQAVFLWHKVTTKK